MESIESQTLDNKQEHPPNEHTSCNEEGYLLEQQSAANEQSHLPENQTTVLAVSIM